jgi:hypothetical protein
LVGGIVAVVLTRSASGDDDKSVDESTPSVTSTTMRGTSVAWT